MHKSIHHLRWLAIWLLAACTLPVQATAPIPTAMPVVNSQVLPTAIPTQAPFILPSAAPVTAIITPTVEGVPSPTALPTDTAEPPLGGSIASQVSLTDVTTKESGEKPAYSLEVVTPILQGPDDPRVNRFNQDISALIQESVGNFRKYVQEQPEMPDSLGSFYKSTYEVSTPAGSRVISLLIRRDIYIAGAAHPSHNDTSYNFDLDRGQPISLEQLFLHGTNPLQPISEYCIAEIKQRGVGFDDLSGALPKPENYSVWTVNQNGLQILFNEYQVAPYAAGEQIVQIPWSALQGYLDPSGPSASLIQP